MNKMNRRGFISGMLATGTAPMLFSGCCNGFCANRKINVAVIGCGRISNSFEVPGVLARKDVARLVAVCDLDSKRAKYMADKIEKDYADGTKIRIYKDYKEVCACKDIDAVMIAIPDFWHALVATTAICSGKAVWLQKPFTQTIQEGRLLANLAKKYNTVMQVGSHQRSWRQFEAVCRAAREGVIGEIKRVEVGFGIDKSGGDKRPQPVPSNFDYETWLGPTDPTVPYNETRCHAQDLNRINSRPGWIQLAPYGWGMITNWGAHHIDIMQWGLGMDASGPDFVEGTCGWMDMSGNNLWNVHTTYDIHFGYNGGKIDGHVCDKYETGIKFIGEKGDWLWCTRDGERMTASDPNNASSLPAMAASKPSLMPKYDPKLDKYGKNPKPPHVGNWLEAIAANDPSMTVTQPEAGHRTATACSLAQMCMELGRGKKSARIEWNPKTEATGNAAADAMMKPFARDKFDLKVNLKEFGLCLDKELKA